jgi:hypothetical protein
MPFFSGTRRAIVLTNNVMRVLLPPVTLPTISGTAGGVLTGVDGSNFGLITARYWSADYVPITGATSTPLDSSSSALQGRQLRYHNVYGTIHSASAPVSMGIPGSLLTIPFDAPDGTLLTNYNLNGGTWIGVNGGYTTSAITNGRTNPYSRMRWSEAPASPEQTVFFDYIKTTASTTSTHGIGVLLRQNGSVSTTGYNVRFQANGIITIGTGREGSLYPTPAGGWTPPANGSTQRLYAKVTTTPSGDVIVSAGLASGNNVVSELTSLTILGTDTTLGRVVKETGYIGIHSTSGSDAALDNLTMFKAAVDLDVKTITETYDVNGRALTINLTYSGTPSGYEASVRSLTGKELVPWTALAGTPAAGSAALTITTKALEDFSGQSVAFSVRQTDTPSIYRTISQALNIFATVAPIRLGINEGYIYSASLLRDGFSRGHWRDTSYKYIAYPGQGTADLAGRYKSTPTGEPGSVKMDYTGRIYGNDLGITTYRFVMYGGTGENCTWTFAPGVVVTAPSAITGWTYNVATGIGTGVLPILDGGSTYIDVLVSSIPSTGLRPSILPANDANPGRTLSDAAYNSTNGVFSSWRFMTPLGVNNDDFTGRTITTLPKRSVAQRWTGPAQMSTLSRESAVGAVNDIAGMDLYWNVSHLDTIENWTSDAAYIAANLAPGRKVFLELSNEIWNTIFEQIRDFRLYALRKGFGPDAATPATAIPEVILDNTYYIGNSTTLRFAVNTGDKILCAINGYGHVVYQAKANFVAGQLLPLAGASDANFDVVYNNAQVTTAIFRGQSTMSKQMFAAYAAAFAAAGRERPINVIATQVNSTSQVSTLLNWDDTYLVTDRFAMAHYWAVNGYYDRVGGEFPQAEKDLLYTQGVAAAADLYFAAAPAVIDARVASAQTTKHWIANYCVSKGLHKDKIKMMQYECNWHTVFDGWPDQAGAYSSTKAYAVDAFVKGSDGAVYQALSAVPAGNAPPNATFWNVKLTAEQMADTTNQSRNLFTTLLRDPRMGTMTTRYLTNFKNWVGGEMEWFVRAQGVVGVDQSWGMLANESDTALTGASTNYRYKALVDFSASISPPVFTTIPSIIPTSGTANSTVFTGYDGTAT